MTAAPNIKGKKMLIFFIKGKSGNKLIIQIIFWKESIYVVLHNKECYITNIGSNIV